MSMSTGSIAKLLTQPTSGERARQRVNWMMRILVGVAAFLAILPLIALIVFVLLKAIPFLVPTFFVNNPLDTEPGILNAIVGSLQLSGLTVLISAPIGIAGGVYLSEFAPPRVVAIGETAIDVMLGVPSIVAGVFAYLILVPVLGFSGWAAVVALSILTLPIMMRSTQEVLRLVPQAIREASLALGVPVWKTALFVSVRTALPGILTGVILAFSRALGETAPLLMTARGTNAENWLDFSTTMNAMPIVIYQYSNAASDLLIGQAWATALVLMAIALTINVLVRGRTVNSRTA